MTLLVLAWRNVLRNRRRSALTATAMALSVAIVMAMMAFQSGMFEQLRDILLGEQIGHVQVHDADYPGKRQIYDTLHDAEALLDALDDEPAVARATARLYGPVLLGTEQRTEGARLIGVPPAAEEAFRGLSDDLVEGRWLEDAPQGHIVLGVDLATKLQASLGDSLVAVTQSADGSLGNVLYDVIGVVETGSPAVDRAGAYVHVTDLGQLLALPDQVHEVVVVAPSHDPEVVAQARDAVAALVDGDDEAVVQTWDEVDPATAQLMAMQDFSGFILIAFFFGVSAIGVVNTLLMSVFERTKEFGVMRALGMRPRQLVALVVLEAVVLGAMAVSGGALLGGLGDLYLVTQGIDLSIQGEGYEFGEMTFDPVIKAKVTRESIVQPVVGVFLFCVLAAIWPAMRAARLTPVDALRED